MNVHDWRRDNVNRMIADVYDTIQAVKPWVTFGVSPFGIWTTDHNVAQREGVPLPPGIWGGNMYQEIYCDPVAWLKQGTVDYISPQLYWRIGGGQDYNTLAPWWANLANRFGVHFYSSMANYKHNPNDGAFREYYTVQELANQARINRTASRDNAPGAVFFNTRAWFNDRHTPANANFAPFRNYFRENIFVRPALPPAINWKPAREQGMVTFNAASGNQISWIYNEDDNVRFAVYAVPIANRNDPNVFSKSDFLLGISYRKEYVLPANVSTNTHRIAVSVFDHFGNEFAPRVMGENLVESTPAQLSFPHNHQGLLLPVTFRWGAVNNADSYIWQLARDENFTDIVCTHETIQHEFSTAVRHNIRESGNGIYYWRVKTRRANTLDAWSEVRAVEFGRISNTPENTVDMQDIFVEHNRLIIKASDFSQVKINIFNTLGQLLTGTDYNLQAGRNEIDMGLNRLANGIYLIQVQSHIHTNTIKVKI
jgi:hypothetical protein